MRGGNLICSVLKIGQLPWHIDTALMGVGFMLFGYCLKKKDCICKMGIRNTILLFIVGSIFILGNDVIVSTLENQLGNPVLFYVGAAALSIVSLKVAYGFFSQAHILAFWGTGKHTLIFMAFNYFFNTVFDAVWKVVFGTINVYYKWCFKTIFVLFMCHFMIVFFDMVVKRLQNRKNFSF